MANVVGRALARYPTRRVAYFHPATAPRTALAAMRRPGEPNVLIEADLNEGVRALPLSHYASFHTRICRPVGLASAELEAVLRSATATT